MVAALQPISGFLNLAPVAPVLPRGRGSEQFVPFVGLAIADASTLVNIGTTPAVPLTYTANGTFTATLKLVPASASADGARHVTLGVSLNLDITVRNTAASSNVALADLRADALRTLNEALTTDLLLAATGSGTAGTSAAGTLDLLSRFLAADLAAASIAAPSSATGATTTSVFSDIFTGGALTALPLTPADPSTAVLGIATPSPTVTAVTGVGVFGALAAPATTADIATPAAAPATALLTAAPATPATATPAAVAAATDAALRRFLTDAVARAHDTVTNNPNYAMAAAALYVSTAVFRTQAGEPAPSGLGRDDPVRMITPAAAVQALPTSVT